ncbi:hypothetical protein [Variovorax sp. Root411]|uniref:hypothetical protein n=1 Tax=Variovorax sp. Root411 TaxID=1736530 RepID=UPI0006FA5A4D|nr:hypothetical protein [Variovorax sp. Root411]KQW64259.1 hypothetical protein ASC92_02075 [Variovorax sp. Root411]
MRVTSLASLLLIASGIAHAQQVYRCGNQYSSEPCGRGGGRVVDVSPPVRNLDSAGASQVFLCVGNSGGRFWSPSHCRERSALVERIESVPAGLPWEQQVQIADQQARQGYAVQQQAMQQRASSAPGVTGASGDTSSCAYFNQQVEYYDRLARQPQSGASQGWIAEQRKAVRDQQFRARC